MCVPKKVRGVCEGSTLRYIYLALVLGGAFEDLIGNAQNGILIKGESLQRQTM